MANISDFNENLTELYQKMSHSMNYHPYRDQAMIFLVIGIVLSIITIVLFYIAHKKNWKYKWVKAIKIILIIATIILLFFGWLSYNITIISA